MFNVYMTFVDYEGFQLVIIISLNFMALRLTKSTDILRKIVNNERERVIF